MESRQFGCYRPGQWGRNPIDRPLGPLSIGVQTSPINDVYVGVIGQGQELSRGRDFSYLADQYRFAERGDLSEDSEEFKIQSDRPDNTRSIANEKKLFFKPLNKRTTKEDVSQILSKLGQLSYLRIPYSLKKRKNLGYGFVIYKNEDISAALISNHINILIDGSAVRFSRFDYVKYKAKGYNAMDGNSDLSTSEQRALIKKPILDGSKLANRPLSTTHQGFSFDFRHFTRPIDKKYYSGNNTANLANGKSNLKFNLEPVRKCRQLHA